MIDRAEFTRTVSDTAFDIDQMTIRPEQIDLLRRKVGCDNPLVAHPGYIDRADETLVVAFCAVNIEPWN